MKVSLEIVEIDGYHSIVLNGKVVCKDSCEDLVDDLIRVLDNLGNIERLNMSKHIFDDHQLEEYEAYLGYYT